MPLAVMGARPGENVFIRRNGDVDPEVYLPAFARRYPFVFAADRGGDELLRVHRPCRADDRRKPGRAVLRRRPALPVHADAMEFLKEFERHRAATEFFVKTVEEAGLFEKRNRSPSPNAAKTAKTSK